MERLFPSNYFSLVSCCRKLPSRTTCQSLLVSDSSSADRATAKTDDAPRGNRTPGSPTLLDGNGEFYH
ncbi:hypothetical protein LY78DRAFT_657364 [Colletotrichum sublineola]|nr:hypothetical protein LY78DRAFT_657364 [Colletotrichum sublineola]